MFVFSRIEPQEVLRKMMHIGLGMTLGLLYYFDYLGKLSLLVMFVCVTLMFFVYLFYKIPGLHQLMLTVERPKDMARFPGLGAIYFALGFVLAAWLFPKNIAVASMMVLGFGDAVTVLVGAYGHVPFFNPLKNWEGILAAAFISAVAASFFVPVGMAIIASVVSMLVEGFDLKLFGFRLNDNVTVPVVCGVVLVLLGTI